jgi:ribosomal protein S12 methylthiotransferase accessory factor YcaO
VQAKKYAVPSVFKLEFKPQSMPKEARSRLEMPERSSTHQGHKRPMSREHILSTIYHHRIGRYSRSVTQEKICPRFSMRMTDKRDDTADTNITPSFAILASTTGTLYLSKIPAVLATMAWIGVSKLKFQWTKTSKAPTQETLMLYLLIL